MYSMYSTGLDGADFHTRRNSDSEDNESDKNYDDLGNLSKEINIMLFKNTLIPFLLNK